MTPTASRPERPARIDQVVPSFAGRDAIGIHVINVRKAIRDLGIASDIWAIDTLPEVRDEAKSLDEIPTEFQPSTWWIYHHSIGTPAADVMAGRPEPVIVDYHNITPAELLGDWVPWVCDEVNLGRKQLAELAPVSRYSLADSTFNAEELTADGYGLTRVVPPLFDLASFESAFDPNLVRELRKQRLAGGSDWLFVGRLSPHKAQHQLVKALAVHREVHDPLARLHLIGTGMGEDYPRSLRRYADRLGLKDAVRITGVVDAAALAAYYQVADVFVCASAHEGFCVPVVEAMHLGLPVVAHAVAAVPETIADGGIVLDDLSPLAMAVAAHRVTTDRVLRESLVQAGKNRAEYFSLAKGRKRIADAIDEAAAFYAATPAAASAMAATAVPGGLDSGSNASSSS